MGDMIENQGNGGREGSGFGVMNKTMSEFRSFGVKDWDQELKKLRDR